jgi:hypothetical protein
MKRSTIQALLNNYSEGGCGIYRAPNNAIVLGEHGVDSFAPEIKNIEAVSDSNHTGFTINFKATDDLGVAKVSAVVWGATQTFDEAKSKGQEFAGTYDPQTEMGSVRINIGQDEGNLMHLSEQYYAVIYVEDIRGNSAVNPDENTSGNELCIAPIELRTSYAGKYKANKDGKGRIWPNTWQEGTLWSETTNTFSYVQDQEIRVSGGYYNSEDRTLYYRVFLGDNHENMPVHIYVKSSDFDSLEKDSDSLWDRIRHLSDDEVVYADGAEGRLILGETKQTLYKPKTKNYPNPYFGDDQGEEEGQYTSTGSCGNDVNYYYYEDLGLLTIKGAGNMYNYYSYSSSKLAPWNEYKNSITTIYIYNGVTSIGNWAFSDCAELTSLTIPDSVTYIGVRAFSDCTGLTSITIPDSVTSIGGAAFRDCTGLTSITIPDSVMEIDEKIFISCDNLAIKCNKGSYAYNYAVKNDIPIEILPGRKRIIKDVVTKKGGLILTNCIEAGPGLFGGKSFRPKCPNCGYESQNTFCATGTGEMSNNIMCRSCGKEYTTTIKAAVNVSYDKGNTVVAGRDWVIAVPDGYHSTCEGIGPNENWCYIVPCDYDLNKDHTQAKPFSFGVGKLNAFGSTLLPNPDSRSISYSNMIKFILNNYGAFNDTNPDNVNEYVINDNCVAFYYSGFNENDPTWIKIKGFICAGSDVRQFHLFRNYDESILDEVEDEYKLLLDVMVKWFDKTKYTGNIVFSD